MTENMGDQTIGGRKKSDFDKSDKNTSKCYLISIGVTILYYTILYYTSYQL